jgi:hypothetical protein
VPSGKPTQTPSSASLGGATGLSRRLTLNNGPASRSSGLGFRITDAANLARHGRDNRLVVWNLRPEEEEAMCTVLPLDPPPEARPQPWMLHILEVNTMNFCSFACCHARSGEMALPSELLVAVPNTLASEAVSTLLLNPDSFPFS